MSHPFNPCMISGARFTAFRPLGQPLQPNLVSQSVAPHGSLQPQATTATDSGDAACQPSSLESLEGPGTAPTPRPASGRSVARDISQLKQADIDALPHFPSAAQALKQKLQLATDPFQQPISSENPSAAAVAPVTVHSCPPFQVNMGAQGRGEAAPTTTNTSPHRHADGTAASPQHAQVLSTPPLPVNTATGLKERSTRTAGGVSDADPAGQSTALDTAEAEPTPCVNITSQASGVSPKRAVTVCKMPPIPVNVDSSTVRRGAPCQRLPAHAAVSKVSPKAPFTLITEAQGKSTSTHKDQSPPGSTGAMSHTGSEQRPVCVAPPHSTASSVSREPSARSLISSISHLPGSSEPCAVPPMRMAAGTVAAAPSAQSGSSAQQITLPPSRLLNTEAQSTTSSCRSHELSVVHSRLNAGDSRAPSSSHHTLCVPAYLLVAHESSLHADSSIHTPCSSAEVESDSYDLPLAAGTAQAADTNALAGGDSGVCVYPLPPFPVNSPGSTVQSVYAACQPAETPSMILFHPNSTSMAPPPSTEQLSQTASPTSCVGVDVTCSSARVSSTSGTTGAAELSVLQRRSPSQCSAATAHSEPPTATASMQTSACSKAVLVPSSPPFPTNASAPGRSRMSKTCLPLRTSNAFRHEDLPSSHALSVPTSVSGNSHISPEAAPSIHVQIDPPFPVNCSSVPLQPHAEDSPPSEPQLCPTSVSSCNPSVASRTCSSSAAGSGVLHRSASAADRLPCDAGCSTSEDASLATDGTPPHPRAAAQSGGSGGFVEAVAPDASQAHSARTWQQWRAQQAQTQTLQHTLSVPGSITNKSASICEIELLEPLSRDLSPRSVSAAKNKKAIRNNKSVSWGHDTVNRYLVPSSVEDGSCLLSASSYDGGPPALGRMQSSSAPLGHQTAPVPNAGALHRNGFHSPQSTSMFSGEFGSGPRQPGAQSLCLPWHLFLLYSGRHAAYDQDAVV